MRPQQPDTEFDLRMMHYALRMAERGLGRCWPNPSVGCVLVKDGHVLAATRTADKGRPHAEAVALAQIGSAAHGATAYVTLEPCAHHGETPPCAQTLIDAGIARVVIACTDPDTRVSGKGAAMLEAAGVAVTTGVAEAEALVQHAGFFSCLQHGRPLLAMKLATSLDGRITNAAGESQWITDEEARNYGHHLRARYDAIVTGIGTVLADDPDLTCRLDGLESHSPVRVILDSQLRLPQGNTLATTARDVPVWVITVSDNVDKRNALEALGVTVIRVAARGGHVDIRAAMTALAERGITRVLTEGGATLNGSLWQSGLVDTLFWFRAPIVLGDEGTPALKTTVTTAPSDLPRLRHDGAIPLGSDQLEIYTVKQ